MARSTCGSQNVQNTTFSDHFWKLRCRKSARRCGAKHISNSKCLKTPGVRTTFGSSDVEKVHATVARSTFRSQNVRKHQGFGPLLEVQMSKKCMPLWREAHVEIDMLKTPGVLTNFGGSDVASLCFTTIHYITLHYTTLHYTTLHNTTTTTIQLHSTTLHYTHTTLHYITLHYTPLHYNYNYNYTTTLHYTPLH